MVVVVLVVFVVVVVAVVVVAAAAAAAAGGGGVVVVVAVAAGVVVAGPCYVLYLAKHRQKMEDYGSYSLGFMEPPPSSRTFPMHCPSRPSTSHLIKTPRGQQQLNPKP